MTRLLTKDFETILNSLEECVIISDRDRNILFFNDTAARILGYKPEHVIGRKCYEVFHSNRCNGKCTLTEALTSGQEVLAPEVKIVDSQGEKTYIKGRTLPFKAGDDLIGVIQLFSNVTELVLLRMQLDKLTSDLNFLTKSPKMMETIDILPDLARSEATILISGKPVRARRCWPRIYIRKARENMRLLSASIAVPCRILF